MWADCIINNLIFKRINFSIVPSSFQLRDLQSQVGGFLGCFVGLAFLHIFELLELAGFALAQLAGWTRLRTSRLTRSVTPINSGLSTSPMSQRDESSAPKRLLT